MEKVNDKDFGIKCKSCGKVFVPNLDMHYVAAGQNFSGIISVNKTYYDAYDCPNCGTQHIMGERKDNMKIRTKEQHEFIKQAVNEAAVSDDTKKRIIAGLLGARIEMRKKNMLTVDAMVAITDGLIYLVAGGKQEIVTEKEAQDKKIPDGIILEIFSREDIPTYDECFGKYDEENVVECGCCKIKKECEAKAFCEFFGKYRPGESECEHGDYVCPHRDICMQVQQRRKKR